MTNFDIDTIDDIPKSKYHEGVYVRRYEVVTDRRYEVLVYVAMRGTPQRGPFWSVQATGISDEGRECEPYYDFRYVTRIDADALTDVHNSHQAARAAIGAES